MIYRFLDFELDEEHCEIRRSGSSVLTQRKAFDFVRHLLLNRDRVVTHDELIEALWQGAARGSNTVPQCAVSARRALGGGTDRHAIIQTVRGRGYRFVAEVTNEDPAAAPAPRRYQTGQWDRSAPQFVGRQELMGDLRTALRDSLSGEARFIMLEGDPGIGKTRAVEELCREAAQGGTTVLTGRCVQDAGTPAFEPWIQTIRDWVRINDGKRIPEKIREDAAFFAGWYSQAPGSVGDFVGPAADGAESRFRLFDRAAEALQGMARHAALVLVLEDLHWADPSTLELLRFLAARLHHDPVLVLGTYRKDELHRTPELPRLLGELARETTFRRLQVEGIEIEHVAALLEQIVGDRVAPALVGLVASMTEGNPFFVVEIARILDADGHVRGEGGAIDPSEIDLPASIFAAIEHRFARLAGESRRLLTVASVIGREFNAMLLSEVAGAESETTLESLEEAVAAGIVEPSRSAPGAYRFSHALMREAPYRGLRGPSQARLHRAVAQTLEQIHGDSAGAPIEELAHHWYAAVATGAVEEAAEYCKQAGLRALSRLAFEEAALHLGRALELADLRPGPDEIERGELLLQLGQAEWSSGKHEAAHATYARAAALARRVSSAPLLARAAIGYCGFEQGLSADATARALLEEAADQLQESSPALRAQVLTKLVYRVPYANSMETRQSMSLEALRLARSCGNADALHEAFLGRLWATPTPMFLEQRIEWEKECRDWGERLKDPRLSWCGNDVVSALSLGDRDGLLHALRESSSLAAASGHRLGRLIVILQQAGFAAMEGRFDDLARFVAQIPEAGKNCLSWAPEAHDGYRFVEALESGRVAGMKRDWLPYLTAMIGSASHLEWSEFVAHRTMADHAVVAWIMAFSGERDVAFTEL
ncbi:MAG: AAA family ATPase, partial [bacterium]|nr:AAA family ATPase [bacterium]